jgi:hypothetical protein
MALQNGLTRLLLAGPAFDSLMEEKAIKKCRPFEPASLLKQQS